MKILSLGMTGVHEPGGLNRYYFGLMRALAMLGHEVQGLVSGEDLPYVEGSLKIEAISGKGRTGRAKLKKRLQWELTHQKYDVINAHFSYFALPVLPLLDIARVPLVITFHGPWAKEMAIEGRSRVKVALSRLIERWVYRKGTRFIVLSYAFGDILRKDYNIPSDRIRVIEPGVDLARFRVLSDSQRFQMRKGMGFGLQDIVIVIVRRLHRRMGLGEFMKSCQSILPAFPHVRVLIAGTGPLADELARMVATDRRLHNVRMLGYVSDDELSNLYNIADFTVLPTAHLEGFGLTILESLASGTPVLGTPVGGIPEVLSKLDPRLVMDDRTSEAMSRGIAGVLRDPAHLPTRQQCRTFVEDYYSWELSARHVFEVFQEATIEVGMGRTREG